MTRFDRTRAKTARARQFRRAATRPEQKLWFHLRGGPFGGFSFRRQHPVGPYVLDFYCAAAKLAVELDGDQHGSTDGIAHDKTRSQFLAGKGISVVRFGNHELRGNLDGVISAIERALRPSHSINAEKS